MAFEWVRPKVAGRKEHAIQKVACAIILREQLSVEDYEQLEETYGKSEAVKSRFPEKKRIHRVEVTYSEVSKRDASRKQEWGGLVFEGRDPEEGEVSSVQVDENTIILTLNGYSSWICAKESMLSALSLLRIDEFRTSDIGAIGLEVADEFWVKDISANWFDELFDNSSRHLPNVSGKLDSYWHSHTGYFHKAPTDTELPETVRLLTNFKVDVRPGPKSSGEDIVSILGMSRVDYLEAWDTDFEHLMKASLDMLHDDNKRVVEDLLSNEMAKEIGI